MIVKTTFSLTDRDPRFLPEKVRQGVFVKHSAEVAAAPKQLIQDEEEREVALSALALEIRARVETPRAVFIDQDDAFAAARGTIGVARGA